MCNMFRFVNLNAELLFIDCFFGAFVLFLAVANETTKKKFYLMPSCIYFTFDKLDRWNLSRIRLVRMIHVSFCRRIKSIVQKTLTNKLLADNSQ